MARLYRDAHGVPHVRAADLLDLARAQGRVVAHDRAWQLEWLRRRATGTAAEVLGPALLPWDRLARRALVVETARRALDALDEEHRAFVGAYAEGVSEVLTAGTFAPSPELESLGVAPAAWPAWMPLATFHAQHVLFANLGRSLWRARAQAALGPEAALLAHEGPEAAGSNAWAVGGGRTASGFPLVAGDPHRTFEAPGCYLQVRLALETGDDADGAGQGFDVVGFTFAGVPGIQHFAHAGEVAWAITNAMADYQDVLPVAESGAVVRSWTEDVPVRGEAPEQLTCRVYEHGPEFTPGHTLRGPSTVLGDLGFGALLPLLRARSVDDVDAALEHWVEPVNNVVVADRTGAVRYRLAGRVPLRTDGFTGEWRGWHPANRRDLAPGEHVVTANERRGAESALVGREFAPPHRARRIDALLTGRSGLTVEDLAAMHADTRLSGLAALHALVPGAFGGWEEQMDAGSPAAARWAAWRHALVARIVEAPLLASLREPAPDPVFAASLDLRGVVGLALPGLAAAGTPFGLDLPGMAREALADVNAAGGSEPWGERHRFAPTHGFDLLADPARLPDGTALRRPGHPRPGLGGDAECVRCTGSLPGVTDAAQRGSVARYGWCLADREASGWVVPLGAAGSPGPHHHDQLEAWSAVRLLPVVTDWARLTEVPLP
ncbi:penicillin acylase family protein [Nocardioides nanhaiensis]|uniref:Penicillin acylase family protein n=1 Tax=Nocardioides nanhaiensis TaxID=1476871 RepID=A0ABP8W762_9ACTN